MKLKYVTSTGALITMGALPDLIPGPGETVIDTDEQIPDDFNWYLYDTDHIRRKTQEEYDLWYNSEEQCVARFNFEVLWGTVWAGALSDTAKIELPPYQTTIEAMWYYPNRSAIYPYMQSLVAAGKGISDDLAIIVAAFSAQDIDIINIT